MRAPVNVVVDEEGTRRHVKDASPYCSGREGGKGREIEEEMKEGIE